MTSEAIVYLKLNYILTWLMQFIKGIIEGQLHVLLRNHSMPTASDVQRKRVAAQNIYDVIKASLNWACSLYIKWTSVLVSKKYVDCVWWRCTYYFGLSSIVSHNTLMMKTEYIWIITYRSKDNKMKCPHPLLR